MTQGEKGNRWCDGSSLSWSNSYADRLTGICYCGTAKSFIPTKSKMLRLLSAGVLYPAVSALPFLSKAKRRHAGTEEETLWQQELQRSDAGANGESFFLFFTVKLPLTCKCAKKLVLNLGLFPDGLFSGNHI